MAAFAAQLGSALVSAAAVLSLASRVGAETAPPIDQGVAAPPAEPAYVEPLPWHGSLFIWDHAVSTQALGLGADYQSSNPTYDMTLRLAPRFYFFENRARSLSVRADVRLVREFTDSDTTTDRGEWTLLDTELWLAEVETLHASPERQTELVFRAPLLVFPTSNVSAKGGRILALGAGVGLDHRFPLRGEGAALLPSMMLRPRANYTYQFVDAVVATGDGIDRVRLYPEGRSLPSDQLSGSAFPQHQAALSARADVDVIQRLGFVAEVGMRYAYRYALPDSVEVCGVVATGCTTVESSADATRWSVSTLFSLSLGYSPLDYLELSIGYVNLSQQLGANGRRRNFFYSPEAQAFLAFTVALDVLYQNVRGESTGEPLHSAGLLPRPPL